MPWSALIGAGTALLGGALNKSSANAANRQAEALANANLQFQNDFAQAGVTWKANDVMRAYKETGIHPLALLGVQGATYSPVSANFMPSGMGDSVSRAGQDISRAITANSDRALRAKALDLQEIQMNNAAERGALENELLRTQIASMRARSVQSVGPPMPSVGDKPLIPGQGVINHPGVERNIIPDLTVTRTPYGSFVILPSEAAKQRMEDMFGLSSQWYMRNVLGPIFSSSQGETIAERVLPRPPLGFYYEYGPVTNEWTLKKGSEYRDPFVRERARKGMAEKLRGIRINRPY